jgi:hypothetical protein
MAAKFLAVVEPVNRSTLLMGPLVTLTVRILALATLAGCAGFARN